VIRVEVTGNAQLGQALRALGRAVERYVEDAINATGLELRTSIMRKYQGGSKTGRMYGVHQASAPGEAPATDTGRLASSVQFRRTGRMEAEVFTDVVYGAMLEWGTRHIAQRPAWRPAAMEIQPKHIERLETAIRRAAGL
jgi:hypothetical protein